MANINVIIVGMATIIAGAMLFVIWNLLMGILPHMPTGPFTYDPTTLFVGAMIIGVIIFIIGLIIPDNS